MCRHLPDSFARLAEFLSDLYIGKLNFTGNFMSDIWSITNEKVSGPAKVLSGTSDT